MVYFEAVLLLPILLNTISGMQYLIDGHNLIPKLGLRLEEVEDELQLLTRLQEFCLRSRARAEVFFDGAPAGLSGQRRVGMIIAHFVCRGSSADAALEAHLARLGKEARNWVVVSSDSRVQRSARAWHAQTLSSEEFARQVNRLSRREKPPSPKENLTLSPQEVEEWLQIFEERKRC